MRAFPPSCALFFHTVPAERRTKCAVAVGRHVVWSKREFCLGLQRFADAMYAIPPTEASMDASTSSIMEASIICHYSVGEQMLRGTVLFPFVGAGSGGG